MRQTILIVAGQSGTLLGLAQAMLKFGYQIATAYADPAEIEKGADFQPGLVLLRPPQDEPARAQCLDLIRTRFASRGVPVLICVSTVEEERGVQERLPGVAVVVGHPVRLNDLYTRMQELFDLARRRELRITTEQVVAHREPGVVHGDFYYYDTMRSLSSNGCFIETAAPYPVGTAIEMVFCIGGGAKSLKLTGRVRRVGEAGSGKTWLGMGVEFENLPESTRAALESFLMNQLGTLDLPSTL